MPIVLDIWKVPKAISFPRKKSDVYAVVKFEGPGGATLSGDIFASANAIKTGTAMDFPVTHGAIQILFQSGSNEDGTRPSVSIGDLNTYHQIRLVPNLGGTRYVFGDELLAEAIAALHDGVSINGDNSVSVYPIGGQDSNGLKGRWGIQFNFGTDIPPTFIDITRYSTVIHTVPAPLDHPKPDDPPSPEPNALIFNITASTSIPDAIPNKNDVTVTGYEQTKATPENPDPEKLKFTDNGDGTIKVVGGDMIWSFSRSAPNLIAYDPFGGPYENTVTTYKFNSKGPL